MSLNKRDANQDIFRIFLEYDSEFHFLNMFLDLNFWNTYFWIFFLEYIIDSIFWNVFFTLKLLFQNKILIFHKKSFFEFQFLKWKIILKI